LKYASCRWKEEHEEKLRRRMRIRRRFVKIKKIGFVAIQHIMKHLRKRNKIHSLHNVLVYLSIHVFNV
jgi:hypothetical protein